MKNKRVFDTVSLIAATLIILAIFVVLILTGVLSEYNTGLLILSGIYIIVSLSLNLITGFTGQLALGHAGFLAIGAYATAIAMMQLHFPILIAILFGGFISAIIGAFIGYPTLKLRGDYLAITTLGFGEIIRVLLVYFEKITGGAAGLKSIPHFFQSDNFLMNSLISFIWVFLFVVATIVLLRNLIHSSPGRAILSIREDEIAANSMGINVHYYKMLSFTLSTFIAGVGGGLFACYFGYLEPNMSGFLRSIDFVVVVVLGGLGSITGTVIGGALFIFSREKWLAVFGDSRLMLFGFLLIFLMMFWRSGLMGNKEWSVTGTIRKLLAGEYKLSNMKAAIAAKFKRKNKMEVR